MRTTRFLIAIITSISLIAAPACPAGRPAYSTDDFLSSRVKDISDRKYEGAVIELLDNAKESIVISMYSMNLAEGTNPAARLVNDLLEARKRGVDVTLYLNTKFQDPKIDKDFFLKNPTINKLKSAGCVIHLMPSVRMLHDKLVIVDSSFIIEGSTNWSIKGLRRNFESSTLIDSPDLANTKLGRLKKLLKFTKSDGDSTYTPYYLENLPKALSIPNTLLLDRQYLSTMVTKQDKRAFKLYMLLLAHSQLIKKDKFFLNLEDMGLSIGLPKDSTDTALRRQVIRSLRKLKLRYNLIDADFFYAKNAFIVMLEPLCHSKQAPVILNEVKNLGTTFTIPTNIIINNKGLSMRLSFFLLVGTYLKTKGEDIGSISNRALGRRFGISESVFRQARNESKGTVPTI